MSLIKFRKNLYSNKSIQLAVEKFQEFGVFEIVTSGKYFDVTVDASDDAIDFDSLLDEFKNYVLFLELTHAKIA